jgi:hypothetical protein
LDSMASTLRSLPAVGLAPSKWTSAFDLTRLDGEPVCSHGQ